MYTSLVVVVLHCVTRVQCAGHVQCESCLCAHWHRAGHCCWYGTPSPTPHFITLVSPSRTLPSSPHHPQAIKSRCPVWASATLCCMRRVWIYSVLTERACLASLVSAGREGVYLPLAHPQHAAARQASLASTCWALALGASWRAGIHTFPTGRHSSSCCLLWPRLHGWPPLPRTPS